MAETSGFATELPQSTYLADTIRRAISAAEQRSHRYVTLEHLLMALQDDPDALALLESARADVPGLRGAATETVNHNLVTLYTPGAFDLRASYKVERVLQSASDDARRMGCAEVDGAFVAVALFHETDSPAYDLLKRYNFVFHAANAWLDRHRGGRGRHAAQPVEERLGVEVMPAADAAAKHYAEEPEAEILLDEIVEGGESAGSDWDWAPEDIRGQPSGPDQVIEPVAWPVVRPGPRSPANRGEGDAGWSRAGSPIRPVTARSTARTGPDTRDAPELNVSARRPSLERASVERGSARSAPPTDDETRAEPRLPMSSEAGRIEGGANPGRGQIGLAGQAELRVESSPIAARQDLGAAVPGRDIHAPGRSAEPAEGRPLRLHASARERSATTSRPILPIPAQETENPAANDAIRGGAERRGQRPAIVPPPAAASAPPRADASLPPATRLDGMRVRPGQTPPPPAPAKKPVPGRDKDIERAARGRRRPQPAGATYAGKLAENIPRKMRAHRRVPVEVRVSREETDAFLTGFEGGGELIGHAITVTQAMSVMLRAPDGGFTIENLGPETQWIFKNAGGPENEAFGRWRWSVAPTDTGQRRLQLVVAARSVDENGLIGDTVLPDQVITVAVGANYVRSFARAIKWIVLMALGGVITEGTLQLLRLVGE